MKKRDDYGSGAGGYFSSLNREVSPLARELRRIIRSALPSVSETIKWGIPVYETDSIICAIRAGRGYVALQFYASGATLKDPDSILEGTGKRMRHIKIRSKSDIRKRAFTSLLRQAARTSNSHP